jgi:hypothetical protein
MTNYVLTYKGGAMAETEEAQQKEMAAWGAWYAALGAAVVDGGNPFGPSMSVAADGSASQGAESDLKGYTILSAESLAAATDLAKGCPVLNNGGSVEVYETFRVM